MARVRHGKSESSKAGSGRVVTEFTSTGTGMKLKTILHLFLAIGAGFLHKQHVSTLFENDRHFSHLSTLEREMGFRTEMGLYYSYFKTVVEAPSFSFGMQQLYSNNITEYPSTINTLKRFNLYPEVTLAAFFRMYRSVNDGLQRRTQTCFRIDRGEGLSPVWSCEGLGDPAYFYLEGAWTAAALVAVALFYLGVSISDGSTFGGLFAVVCFFFNQGEATRVQWTPPLRETFGQPLLLIQMYLVTKTIEKGPSIDSFFLTLATTVSILVWQFTQFSLFTQTIAIFVLFNFDLISKEKFMSYVKSVMVGLGVSFVVMFGNEMLITSWLFGCLVSSVVLAFVSSTLDSKLGPTSKLTKGFLLLTMTVLIKKCLSAAMAMEDDAHVANILKAKFSSYKDFHTSLYTCAKEFDFLGWEMPYKTTLTLLLPAAALATVLALVKAARPLLNFVGLDVTYNLLHQGRERSENLDPVVGYHILQMFAYGFMAVIVMRLKLFFTPQLCIVAALLFNPKYIPALKSKAIYFSILALLVAGMSVKGVDNIKRQREIIGEYSNPELEELIEWINATLPENESSAMAGPMPTMANLLLSTRRPVVNHPHYEDAGLRNRTREIYKMYSRRTAREYHKILVEDLKVKYLVVVSSWCFENQIPNGCGMVELWDHEEPKMKGVRSPLCPKLFGDSRPLPFKRVFQNSGYVVLKV